MRKYPVFAVVWLWMVVLLAGCGDSPGGTPSADQGSMELTTASGRTLDWADLRGQWVLVNYWAEWCRPCLEEIPELNQVNAGDEVTVLAVNFDGVEGEELKALGERMGIRFTMLADDPAQSLGWDMPGALPVTFLVNPQGQLTDTLMGAQTEQGLLALMGAN